MGQFSKVLFAIDNAHTIPHMALDCGSDIGGLNPSCSSQPYVRSYDMICVDEAIIITM